MLVRSCQLQSWEQGRKQWNLEIDSALSSTKQNTTNCMGSSQNDWVSDGHTKNPKFRSKSPAYVMNRNDTLSVISLWDNQTILRLRFLRTFYQTTCMREWSPSHLHESSLTFITQKQQLTVKIITQYQQMKSISNLQIEEWYQEIVKIKSIEKLTEILLTSINSTFVSTSGYIY